MFYFNLVFFLVFGLCSQLNGQTALSGQNLIFEKIYEQHIKQLHYLNEPHPKLLIMFSGTPAMGKTTVAKALADHFHAVRVSSDDGRRLLRNCGQNIMLVHSYLEWLLPKLEANFPNHRIIFDRCIDSVFPFYEKFALDHSFPPFLIRMKLERAEAERRIRARKKTVRSLLRNNVYFWRDYENFSKTHTPDFVFDNSGPTEIPLQQLETKIQAFITAKNG